MRYASNNASTFYLLLEIEPMGTGGSKIRTLNHPGLYRCIIPQDLLSMLKVYFDFKRTAPEKYLANWYLKNASQTLTTNCLLFICLL